MLLFSHKIKKLIYKILDVQKKGIGLLKPTP